MLNFLFSQKDLSKIFGSLCIFFKWCSYLVLVEFPSRCWSCGNMMPRISTSVSDPIRTNKKAPMTSAPPQADNVSFIWVLPIATLPNNYAGAKLADRRPSSGDASLFSPCRIIWTVRLPCLRMTYLTIGHGFLALYPHRRLLLSVSGSRGWRSCFHDNHETFFIEANCM